MSYFEHEALLGEPIGISKNSITSTEEFFLKFLGVFDETLFVLLLLFLLKCGWLSCTPYLPSQDEETWTKHVFAFVPSLL